MSSLTLKEVPEDLHAQLKQEAAANFRTPDQEVLARLQRTFEQDAALTTKQVNTLIAEAIASGPEEELTRAKFDGARRVARTAHAKHHREA